MLKNYLKIALKGLGRHKYYTFVSLFGIIMTLIVVTISIALFNHTTALGKSGSKLDRCLLSNRIEAIFKEGHIGSLPSYWLLDHYFRNLKEADTASYFSRSSEIVVYANNNRIPVTIKYTDEVFWDITEYTFTEGMPYRREDVESASKVAVITDLTKQKIFGNEPAVGKYMETSSGTYRIIGIIPYKEINAMALSADIYAPITNSIGAMTNDELWGDANALYLVSDKSKFPALKREFQGRVDQVRKDFEKELNLKMLDVFLGTQLESVADTIDQNILVYYAGVIGIMLLFISMPAINLTVINFSRIFERFSEIGIRKACGASSLTLMGQFILENVILTLIGGLIAFLMSGFALSYINGTGIVPWGFIELDTKTFIYCMIATVIFGVISGILPSFRMSRVHPAEALKGVNQ